ncbi:MAG: FapA family protein, partial [Desulfobulbaceae bacterium]|nr:FapA family protein [Desulfobulbaceae bacterium]
GKSIDKGLLKNLEKQAIKDSGDTLVYLSAAGVKVHFCQPEMEGEYFSLTEVATISDETLKVVNAPRQDEVRLRAFSPWTVFPGEVIARCDDTAESDGSSSKRLQHVTLLMGPNVTLTPSGEYLAQCYGYVVLKEQQLEVCSPLWIDSEAQNVYWLILGQRTEKVVLDMLEYWFNVLDLAVEPDKETISKILQTLSEHVEVPVLQCIARGKLPQNGTDGWGEIIVNIEKTVGKEQDDGSMDYYDVNVIPVVTNEQVLAKYYPASSGEDGFDVYGNDLLAIAGKDKEYVCGKNVVKGSEGGNYYYYATADGTISFEHNKLSVFDLLVLEDGVNFETGNIDFSGRVQIKGPILPGFTVKAAGDITIAGMVENDTVIISSANIDVGHGIAGRKTLLQAGGSITAQFVHEAKLVAGHDITLGNYGFHAILRAGHSVIVKRGIGERAGCIVGGKTWAKKEIEALVAGAPTWPATELLIGLTMEQADALDKLQQEIESHNIHIKKILEHLGLPRIDLEQIKRIINKADGATRKRLAFRAKHLGKLAESYKKLLEQRKDFMNSISELPKGSCVRIKEMIYPGVVVFLGSKEQKITDELPGINLP